MALTYTQIDEMAKMAWGAALLEKINDDLRSATNRMDREIEERIFGSATAAYTTGPGTFTNSITGIQYTYHPVNPVHDPNLDVDNTEFDA